MFHSSPWYRIARQYRRPICKNFSKNKFSNNSAILFIFKKPFSLVEIKNWLILNFSFENFFKNFLSPIVYSVFYTIPHYLQKFHPRYMTANYLIKTAIFVSLFFQTDRRFVAASISSLTNFFVVRRLKRLSSVSTNENQGSYYATFHFHLTTLAIL